ncbi:MAG: glycosyltransferase family 4 protein [Ruminococcus sp.]|nr:glycosyltransferase family 4 protein [Ruminococcus sp.]
MRILWIVNLVPLEVAKKVNISSVVLGGWVESMAAQLNKNDDITLAIACKTEKANEFNVEVNGVNYYSVGYDSSTKLDELESMCKYIVDDFKPDIIQIEGTEFLHAKAMLNVGNSLNIPTLVSMQGILNGQYQYQCGQLQIDDMMFSRSIKNIFAAWILHLRKTRWFKPRLKAEYDIISTAKYVMGRTTWDRAHVYRINPDAKYYSCNRILRAPFYNKHWDINNIERHSLYVGNGYFALKGVHYVIQALPELIREYPDIKLYVAGNKPFFDGDKRPFYKKGYGLYLEKLVDDLGVREHVIFTGPLSADEVADKLSKVHAYVLCSAIENSPNTLGEAMLIGTPSVSAYVGGASDMATDGFETLFYRNDDPALLAWNIKKIFDDDEFALEMSRKAHKRAEITHSEKINSDKLHNIYFDILIK